MFLAYTSVQGAKVFMRNYATSKVIDEGTIQFRSRDGTSQLFKELVIFPIQGIISSLLESYKGKDSVSVLKVIL